MLNNNKISKMKYICALTLTLLILFSCKREKACTEEFRMLSVTIYNNDNSLFEPDAYYVVRMANGDTLFTRSNNPYNETFIEGIVIFTDNEMKYTNNKGGTLFMLTAYKDSVQLVNEQYLIKHDDCHFELVSGKTEIVL